MNVTIGMMREWLSSRTQFLLFICPQIMAHVRMVASRIWQHSYWACDMSGFSEIEFGSLYLLLRSHVIYNYHLRKTIKLLLSFIKQVFLIATDFASDQGPKFQQQMRKWTRLAMID